IVDLDSKRNQNREALRALGRDPQAGPVTVCFGNMFINLPKHKTQEMIERGECCTTTGLMADHWFWRVMPLLVSQIRNSWTPKSTIFARS
ncbi:hypothetical protein GDO78_018745, partial [Eleutherodactylus coqui]